MTDHAKLLTDELGRLRYLGASVVADQILVALAAKGLEIVPLEPTDVLHIATRDRARAWLDRSTR